MCKNFTFYVPKDSSEATYQKSHSKRGIGEDCFVRSYETSRIWSQWCYCYSIFLSLIVIRDVEYCRLVLLKRVKRLLISF